MNPTGIVNQGIKLYEDRREGCRYRSGCPPMLSTLSKLQREDLQVLAGAQHAYAEETRLGRSRDLRVPTTNNFGCHPCKQSTEII